LIEVDEDDPGAMARRPIVACDSLPQFLLSLFPVNRSQRGARSFEQATKNSFVNEAFNRSRNHHR